MSARQMAFEAGSGRSDSRPEEDLEEAGTQLRGEISKLYDSIHIRRMWVNAPSTLQPEHDRHGTLVLAHKAENGRPVSRCYFLSGDVESAELITSSLSPGWPMHLRPKP